MQLPFSLGFYDNIYHDGIISKMPDFDGFFSLLECKKCKLSKGFFVCFLISMVAIVYFIFKLFAYFNFTEFSVRSSKVTNYIKQLF